MNLFVYGSLMEPKILKRLIGRVPKMQKVVLRDFCLARHGVRKFRKYRVAIPRHNAKVIGKLLVVNRKEFTKIHKYEQTAERIWGLKRVIVLVGRKKVKASAYLANKKFYS